MRIWAIMFHGRTLGEVTAQKEKQALALAGKHYPFAPAGSLSVNRMSGPATLQGMGTRLPENLAATKTPEAIAKWRESNATTRKRRDKYAEKYAGAAAILREERRLASLKGARTRRLKKLGLDPASP